MIYNRASSLLLALWAGCAAPSVAAITLVDVPGDTTALRVTATLDGAPVSGQELLPAEPRFALRLPAGSRGRLRVSVQALTGGQCAAAQGEGEVQLPAARQDLTIPLTALSPRRCSLVVELVGPGEVHAQERPLHCPGICADHQVPEGATVHLTALPTAPGHLLGWAGACEDWLDCSVTVNQSATVRATFTGQRHCGATAAVDFCWEHPQTQGNSLHGLWGVAGGPVFAVGDNGTLLRYQDGAFAPLPAPAEEALRLRMGAENLRGVWASAADDLWVLGRVSVYHFDGKEWTEERPSSGDEDLNALWGVVDAQGPNLSELWAAGGGGRVFRRQGGRWSLVPGDGDDFTLAAIWGRGRGELYLVGSKGSLLAWDGQQLRRDAERFEGQDLGTVVGRGEELWVAGPAAGIWRRVGARWQRERPDGVDSPTVLTASGASLWVLGNAGNAARFDGQRWRSQNVLGAVDFSSNLYAAWGPAADDLWVGGTGGLLMHLRDRWQRVQTGLTRRALQSVWGRGAELFAVGRDGAVQSFDGRQWRKDPIKDPGGMGLALRSLFRVAGSGSELWAVGDGGLVLRRNSGDGSWAQEPLAAGAPQRRLYGLWAGGAEAFAAGEGGLILRRGANGQWQPESSGSPQTLYHLAGGGGAVWAVGEGGTVLRRALEVPGWSPETSPTQKTLRALWVAASGVVWAGGDGVLLRRDPAGGQWQEVRPTAEPLPALLSLGEGAGGLWALGSYDLLALDAEGTGLRSPRLSYAARGTQYPMLTLWGAGAELIIAGENGAMVRLTPRAQ